MEWEECLSLRVIQMITDQLEGEQSYDSTHCIETPGRQISANLDWTASVLMVVSQSLVWASRSSERHLDLMAAPLTETSVEVDLTTSVKIERNDRGLTKTI